MSRAAPVIETAEQALAIGNLLLAYDDATKALSKGREDRRLRYIQVLALARMNEMRNS